MNDKRNLLKVITVAGATGAVWQKPVVDAVMLPAHAETSGCSLASGTDCFRVIAGNDFGSSRINWPGGAGPHFDVTYEYWDEPIQSCSGDPSDTYTSDFVIASNRFDAARLLGNMPNYIYGIGSEGCFLYEYDDT